MADDKVKKIKLTVKMPRDKLEVLIAPDSTVRELKKLLLVSGKLDNVPVDSQCIIMAGRVAKDDKTLVEQGITDGVTVHLVVRSTPQSSSGTNTAAGSIMSSATAASTTTTSFSASSTTTNTIPGTPQNLPGGRNALARRCTEIQEPMMNATQKSQQQQQQQQLPFASLLGGDTRSQSAPSPGPALPPCTTNTVSLPNPRANDDSALSPRGGSAGVTASNTASSRGAGEGTGGGLAGFVPRSLGQGGDFQSSQVAGSLQLLAQSPEIMAQLMQNPLYQQMIQEMAAELMQQVAKAACTTSTVGEKEDDLHVHQIPKLEGLDKKKEKGRGSYGAVFEVKLNGLPCIAKGLHDILVGQGGNYAVGEQDKQAIKRKFHNECILMSKLKHPNIVQFLGVHSCKDDEFLVMEYMHMDLDKCLNKYFNISLPIKLSILQDVSYGLLHLHSLEPPIIHRDLTASNILLTPDMRAKIADLGVSKMFDLQQIQRTAVHTAVPGTLAYMPPEVLSPDPKYDTKLDIFSFGVLSLYTANQAFPIVYDPPIPMMVSLKKEIQFYRRKHWIDKMGEKHPLYSVVHRCLQDSPKARPVTMELNGTMSDLCLKHKREWNNILDVADELQKLKAVNSKLSEEVMILTQQVKQHKKQAGTRQGSITT